MSPTDAEVRPSPDSAERLAQDIDARMDEETDIYITDLTARAPDSDRTRSYDQGLTSARALIVYRASAAYMGFDERRDYAGPIGSRTTTGICREAARFW